MSIMLFKRNQAICMDLRDIALPTLCWALFDHYRVAYAHAVMNDYGTSIDV